jgi:hypothetical protein
MEEHDDLSAASWEAAYQEELQAEEEGLKRAWDGLLATRVVEGHVGTPSIPTPEAEFTHPRKLEEAHIMSIGEDPTHREVDALTRQAQGEAQQMGQGAAAGRHRRTRQERGHQAAAGCGRGDRGSGCHGCGSAPSREGHSPEARTSRYARGADHRPGSSWRTTAWRQRGP